MNNLFNLVESMSTMIAKEFHQRGFINVNFDSDSVEGVDPITGKAYKWTCTEDGKKIVKSKTIKQLNQ